MVYKMKRGDLILIAELSTGASPIEAAKKAGIHKGTAYVRVKNPEFMELVNKRRFKILDETAGILIDASTAAANHLWDLMESPKTPKYISRQAATDILTFTLRMQELLVLERRIENLENELMK